MALSPNYGWSEPDNSSLVKNGAADIRTLGDSIDTSVWNVGFGQAGKNKVINSDFRIAQRGTSFSSPASGSYTLDRWLVAFDGTGATRTVSQQAFTPGGAPVAGYEAANFIRCAQTVAGSGNTFVDLRQRIEDVRTFAGNTVTVSFWAKAAATQTVTILADQDFGSGGSATVFNALPTNAVTLTTSWQRFTYTASVASISGKTIGTSSYLSLTFRIAGGSTFTVDVFGVQLEYGSKATPFQTASGGSIQGELAMCQRYYWRSTNNVASTMFSLGAAYSTTAAQYFIKFPISMRIYPSSLDYSNLNIQDIGTGTLTAPTAVAINTGTPEGVQILATGGSGFTQYRPYGLTSPNSTAVAYVGFSAEL